MPLKIIAADYANPDHAKDIVYLSDLYARDEMGMQHALPDEVKEVLVEELRKMPTAFTYLAYDDGQPVGIVNCFLGFSTFQGKKLINIHDLAVVPKARGQGFGERLLMAVQKKAKQLGCCKITLEVRDDNPARRLYERFGFETDDPPMWFMTKELY